MNEKLQLIIASFGVPIFVVFILFIFILLSNLFPNNQSLEERQEALNSFELETEINDLVIEVEDLNIDFAKTEEIFISDELKLEKDEDFLEITRGDGLLDRLYLVDSDIIIPGGKKYNSFNLTGNSLNIAGELATEKLLINYDDINLDLILFGQELIITGEKLAGSGLLKGEELRLKVANLLAVDLELEDYKTIEIITKEIDSSLKFSDISWDDKKSMIVNAESGMLRVLIPESNKDKFDLQSIGGAEVKLEYY